LAVASEVQSLSQVGLGFRLLLGGGCQPLLEQLSDGVLMEYELQYKRMKTSPEFDGDAGTNRALVVALLVAAVGTWVARAAEGRSPPGPGVVILVVAAIVVIGNRTRWAPVAAVVAVLLVLASHVREGLSALVLAAGSRPLVTFGGWLLALGSVVALGTSVRLIATRRAPPKPVRRDRSISSKVRSEAPRDRLARLRLVLGLMLLSAICAEDLAAYDDTTGRPTELLFGLVLFGCLYGGPALLVREVVRRTGRGWPAIFLLSAAAGLVQAGLIDQSLFNDSYREIESWGTLYGQTRIDVLGLSAYATQSFIVGHVIYSFCAPIALVEAMSPTRARTAWLGRRALAVVGALYLAVAALVLNDTLTNEPTQASIPQVIATVAIVAALVIAARMTRPIKDVPAQPHRAPRPWVVLAASFVFATLLAIAPETWVGVTISVLLLLVGAFALLRMSRGPGWTLRHAATAAAGAVISRGVLAFAYYPVIGDVSAARKYTHNVVMLLIVGAAIAHALRSSRQPQNMNHTLVPASSDANR
jgi:hypothetical protein